MKTETFLSNKAIDAMDDFAKDWAEEQNHEHSH